ncbi:MAG: wax ester/triacylglycerol synthase family O-acyltransferase [Ilumatobacter sp.]|uniref:wax ester/triacylglycerol synthase domain-containing protein n=1 Tax=Ilumatobacter sp. TaxID=1967498 RepID=UPI00260A9BD6|nr:wax ester/triacylglycerol synthase domain-containing protein [Ilumatobacter sp.]MDJ0771644.1 wax ester/triacylglycerol synthase family O-acyltransferase [Ilumatobacter sp.]
MPAVHYRTQMSSSDAIIWHIEDDPHLQSTVMAVWLLDSVPTDERMQANIDRMIEAIPRLRERVEPARQRPNWVAVDDLDVTRHYSVHAMPEGSGPRNVLDFAEGWANEPFDRARPLWRLGLLTGLEGGGGAAVIKVHHAIADGLGMVLMLAAFTDLERDPPPVEPTDFIAEEPEREAFGPVRRMWFKTRQAATTVARRPLHSVVDATATASSTIRLVFPHRTPHSKLMTERSGRRHLDARAIPLDDIKRASKRSGASINDVFVSIFADATDRYHAAHGVACRRLRVHVPVNSRTERTAGHAGNDFVPARLSLVVPGGGADQRLASVSEQLTRLRAEPALKHINPVSAFVQRLGKPIAKWIVGGMMKGVDILASNVQGPPFPLYLAGAKVDEFYAMGPPAGASVNITMFSYDGVASFSITSDAAAIADRAGFLRCLDEAIADATTPAPVTAEPVPA